MEIDSFEDMTDFIDKSKKQATPITKKANLNNNKQNKRPMS
jgi:hypothetical protein